MVSIEKIVQKFLQLDEYLGLLRNISRTPIKDFLNDRILVGVHRFRVQRSQFTPARLPYCWQGWQAGFRVAVNPQPLNPEPVNRYKIGSYICMVKLTMLMFTNL